MKINFNILTCVYTSIFIKTIHCENLRIDCNGISNDSRENNNNTNLILTPYIESGRIEDAQSMASVNLDGFEDVQSYAGYFTVNPEFNSNLFFWYFVAEEDPKNAPVVLWLQGGPGAPSTSAIFYINGPFAYKKGILTKRYQSWNKKYHMIYIDNPVGTGYSYTDFGYAKNQTVIGNDLLKALIQFFKLFPDLKNNDFYISGESYAGKYIPGVSYVIHNNNNKNAELKINLKGFAIGNGFTHPIIQSQYSDHLYKIGFIDRYSYKIIKTIESIIAEYIKNENWDQAYKQWRMYNALWTKSLIIHYTHSDEMFLHHILKQTDVKSLEELNKIISSPELMKSLNSGSLYVSRLMVYLNLKFDMLQSMAYEFSELLSHYRAIVYNGQLDLQVTYRKTEDYLMNLTFSGCEEFRNNKRRFWMVDGELAGYVKTGGNLTTILVRNAGHSAAYDQPKWSLDIMEKLTKNIQF